jgi:hypothetical protein
MRYNDTLVYRAIDGDTEAALLTTARHARPWSMRPASRSALGLARDERRPQRSAAVPTGFSECPMFVCFQG